jgi:hypothetical protein
MTVHHAAPHPYTTLNEQVRITAGHTRQMRLSALTG